MAFQLSGHTQLFLDSSSAGNVEPDAGEPLISRVKFSSVHFTGEPAEVVDHPCSDDELSVVPYMAAKDTVDSFIAATQTTEVAESATQTFLASPACATVGVQTSSL